MFSIIFKSTIQTFLNAIISFSFATILCIKKKKKELDFYWCCPPYFVPLCKALLGH